MEKPSVSVSICISEHSSLHNSSSTSGSNVPTEITAYAKEINPQMNDIVDQHHEKSTRNNNIYLKLPVVRTEFARKSAYFMAAKIYNDLPIDIRRCKSFERFFWLFEGSFQMIICQTFHTVLVDCVLLCH